MQKYMYSRACSDIARGAIVGGGVYNPMGCDSIPQQWQHSFIKLLLLQLLLTTAVKNNNYDCFTTGNGTLVCEYYNCDDGACIRSYKVCENCSVGNGTCGCSTIYFLNSTNNKLYLHSKDCISDLQAPICATPQCVINTTFNGSLAGLYICYCNVSLCNMNETVLYPTRLMSYGMSNGSVWDREWEFELWEIGNESLSYGSLQILEWEFWIKSWSFNYQSER